MRLRRLSVIVAFVFAVAFAPGSAKADGGGVVDLYNVSGSLTITGNNACPPAPSCTEVVNFSFIIGSVDEPIPNLPNNPYQAFIVSGTASSTGPLAPFNFDAAGLLPGNDGGECGNGDCNRVTFFNSNGDEIDLHMQWASASAPITPVVSGGDLYECGAIGFGDPTCVQQMFNPNYDCCMFLDGTVQATVTPVAEPAEWMMLAAGLGLLGLMASRRRGEAQ
jgi:hypothetical protein